MALDKFSFLGSHVEQGERRNVELVAAQTYSGQPVTIRAQVWRAAEPGPTVMISSAIHGDEINGTGVVREIVRSMPFELIAGTLILVPIVNVLGFEQNARYMPDGRDLNRFFPGTRDGSLTSRFAKEFFVNFVSKCDFIIDLHSAAWKRTNFPNVRADLGTPAVARLAEAMDSELVVSGKGPKGSLRHEAVKAGVPTIVLEAGEVYKIERGVVEYGMHMVRNVLFGLGMIEKRGRKPVYRATIRRSSWMRAHMGGFLDFHVAPGDFVRKNQPVSSNVTLFGEGQNVLKAPFSGIVLGMTTLPAVMPGDPVVHLGQPVGSTKAIAAAIDGAKKGALHERLRSDLQTNLRLSEFFEE